VWTETRELLPIPLNWKRLHLATYSGSHRLAPFQAFNPLMIFTFTPFVIGFWARQEKGGMEPSTVTKMALNYIVAPILPPAEGEKGGVYFDPRRGRYQRYAAAQVFANSSIDVPSILGLVF
jgi:hypothetical protein